MPGNPHASKKASRISKLRNLRLDGAKALSIMMLLTESEVGDSNTIANSDCNTQSPQCPTWMLFIRIYAAVIHQRKSLVRGRCFVLFSMLGNMSTLEKIFHQTGSRRNAADDLHFLTNTFCVFSIGRSEENLPDLCRSR